MHSLCILWKLYRSPQPDQLHQAVPRHSHQPSPFPAHQPILYKPGGHHLPRNPNRAAPSTRQLPPLPPDRPNLQPGEDGGDPVGPRSLEELPVALMNLFLLGVLPGVGYGLPGGGSPGDPALAPPPASSPIPATPDPRIPRRRCAP